MVERVTHQSIQRSTLRNLQTNLDAMARLQGQMSSGKKIQVPSDDPAVTGSVMHLRSTQRQIDQYSRNANDGDSWLTTVDAALGSSLTALRRVRDLVVQSGNGGLGPSSREALAAELEGLRDDLVSQANTTYLGRTVFAGTSGAGVAFDATYAWSGSSTATVERQIGPTTTVRVDANGAQVYGEGAGSVFALVDRLAADLRAGIDVTDRLDAIDERMDAMLTSVASTGSRQRVLQSVATELTSQALTVKTQLTGAEDIDLAEVIMNLQLQEVAYQGALGAGARVLQPSLMDFLR